MPIIKKENIPNKDFDKKGILFLEIPFTGTRTLNKIIDNFKIPYYGLFSNNEKIEFLDYEFCDENYEKYDEGIMTNRHSRYFEYEKIMGDEILNYQVATIIRNPYDRYISLLAANWRPIQGQGYKKVWQMDEELFRKEFRKNLMSGESVDGGCKVYLVGKDIWETVHLIEFKESYYFLQFDDLNNEFKKFFCDYLGFEEKNLVIQDERKDRTACWEQVGNNEFGKPLEDLLPKEKYRYRKYYDNDTKKEILKWYEEDIELFNFKF